MSPCKRPLAVDMMNVERAAGAAQRRRGRRLRAALRHERQSIAMALAEMSHHTAPRGLRMARAGEEESETMYTAKFRATPPPQPVLFSLFDEEPGGGRPEALVEPRPQARVQRHTVEHITDLVRVAPMVQILDAPVPQTGDQLPDILSFFGALMPDTEQVIDVPKILLDDVPMRAAERDTQLGEQLVEVPTDPGYALAVVASKLCSRRELRQIIAGLQGGGGTRGSLQGSRAGQNSTGYLEQIVVNPVQVRREGGGSVQVSLPVQNSAAVVEQIVDIPARRVPGFLSGQVSASSSSRLHDAADEDFTGVFRTFTVREKSTKLGSHSGSELLPESSPSTRRAYEHPNAPG